MYERSYSQTQIETACLKCSSVFIAKAAEVRRGGGKYCSRKCYLSRERIVRLRECDFCSQTFEYDIRYKSNRFCSHECYSRNRAAKPFADRFWPRVQKGDGCWKWLGNTDSRGYGVVKVPEGAEGFSGKFTKAHRVAFYLANGYIDKDLSVCHKCDNPACVNPSHLFLGTHSDNMQDMFAKGRNVRGERCPHAKLTADDVREIRSSTLPGYVLAEKYGISANYLTQVRLGHAWEWLKD